MGWRIPIVDLAAEYAEVGSDVEAAVLRVLRSNRYVLGPETTAFEDELACMLLEQMAADPARLVHGPRIRLGAINKGTIAITARLRAGGARIGRS